MKDHEKDTEMHAVEPRIIELRTFAPEDELAESVDDEDLLERKRQEQIDRIEVEDFWAGRNHASRRSGRIAA